MSEQDKRAAKEHMARAGRQANNASREAAEAAKAAGEVAAEETADAVKNTTEEVREGAEEAKRHLPHLSARGIAAISSDTGVGFLALSVSIYSGAIAFYKFKSAIQGRGRAID